MAESPPFVFSGRALENRTDGGSLSQRVSGLSRHSFHVVTFWVSAESVSEKAFFVTTDKKWAHRTYIPPST